MSVSERGVVWGWGNNEYRQLGVASDEPQLPLARVVECLGLDGGVVSIAAGGAFTAFLTSEQLLEYIYNCVCVSCCGCDCS